MKRVIYSLYIDIPRNELDLFDEKVLGKNKIPINYATKHSFKIHYLKLLACKQAYAHDIGVDFKMFEYDSDFIIFKENFNKKYPFITSYNIVNFYKLHLLYKLAEEYDEILYLDFDVVPVTKESFFDKWDFQKGICVYDNTYKVQKMEVISEKTNTIRSPSSKYYNTQAMLFAHNLSMKNNVINTGIIGTNRKHLEQLNYFGSFESDLSLMTELKQDTSFFPKKIVDFFGYDNETLFSFKLEQNKVPVQWLDSEWHYFFSSQQFIPKETKLIHAINKNFDLIWKLYD